MILTLFQHYLWRLCLWYVDGLRNRIPSHIKRRPNNNTKIVGSHACVGVNSLPIPVQVTAMPTKIAISPHMMSSMPSNMRNSRMTQLIVALLKEVSTSIAYYGRLIVCGRVLHLISHYGGVYFHSYSVYYV